MKQELIDFLKHIKEDHTDEYGTLQIVDDGDELDSTIESVVEDYLKSKKIEIWTKEKTEKMVWEAIYNVGSGMGYNEDHVEKWIEENII